MGIGKRQLVLATLVVALGAAVYLNWQFTDDNQLVATEALTSEKEFGDAQLVNVSGTESTPTQTESSSSSSAVVTNTQAEAYFTEARLSRQKARDSAVELIESTLANVQEDDETKKQAVQQASDIAENMVQESNIESLIKAKGFADCVVFLQNGECSVVVQTEGLLPNEAIAIKDIIGGQSGVSYDKIKIVEAK